MVDFNRIYEDSIVKVTVNVDRTLMQRAFERMKKLGLRPKGHFSVYLRALIRKDCESDAPITISQFLKQQPEYLHKEYADPPRKYSGFVGGLLRNSFVLNWSRKRKNKY